MDNKKPNIVYIFTDDMGYGDVSCLNENSKIQTDNVDRLAAEGMCFRDAHATSSVCTPSRYSVLTGRYNWRSHLKKGIVSGYGDSLIEDGRMTVASMLQEQGYKTACIGKWHLGWNWHKNSSKEDDVDFEKPISGGPTDAGFDYFFGISGSLDMPPYVYVENDKVTAIPDRTTPGKKGKEVINKGLNFLRDVPDSKVTQEKAEQIFWREGAIAPDFRHEEVLPNLTEKAVSFIDQRSQDDNPFFLYFPLPAPHTPILPTERFQGKSGVNDYADFCLQVDDVVGQIDAEIEKHGIKENTIVVFASDNGCAPMVDFKELAAYGHHPSYIFRGHKADIYEGGHRVPLIVRWPGEIPEGTTSDETVCLVDILATCADILGVELPDNAGEDSISNLEIWRGRKPKEGLREATVHHSVNGTFSIRQGKWKLEFCPGSGGWSYPTPGTADVDGLPSIQLYDLEADIGEQENKQAEYPEVVQRLTELMTRYVRDGRSTPGEQQPNTGAKYWPQLNWMTEDDL